MNKQDNRFSEFLKERVEYYPFAQKLMDFCLVHSTNPSWEMFSRKFQFPVRVSSNLIGGVCYIIFGARYARAYFSLGSGRRIDVALELLSEVFGQDTEIASQRDGKALSIILRTEENCDALFGLLLGDPDIQPSRDINGLKVSREKRKERFEAFMYQSNKKGSGKATSYLRALDLICEMLNSHPKGFEDCRDIWSVVSTKRLEDLSELVRKENNLGSKSDWDLPGIPSSYLQKGYCSAALAAYIDFLDRPIEQDFSHYSKIFCQIALFWLLDKRESLIEQKGLSHSHHPVLFDGGDSESRWCWNGDQDLDELNLKVSFAEGFCRASHYLRSISRFAPEIANFVSLLALPEDDSPKLMDSFRKALGSFNLCLDAIRGKHISRDLSEIIEDVGFDCKASGGVNQKPEKRIPPQVFEFMASSFGQSWQGESPAVYDPCCGYGSLLLSFFEILEKKIGRVDLLEFSGSEADADKANLCKVGLMLRSYALMRDGKLDVADFSNYIYRVAPNLKVENSLNQYQDILRKVRNLYYHDSLVHCLSHEGTYDCILSAPQFGTESVDIGALAISSNQQFLLLSRLLLKSEGEAFLLLPETFRDSMRDQEFRRFMLQFFAPRSITSFRGVVFGGESFDKVLLGLDALDRPKWSGEVEFRNASIRSSQTRKMEELFNIKGSSQDSLGVLVSQNICKCSVEVLATNSSKFIPRQQTNDEREAHFVGVSKPVKVDFGTAAQYWEGKISKISQILEWSSKFSKMLEDERKYHPTQTIGEVEKKDWLRMTIVPGAEVSPLPLMELLESGNKGKGCAYFEIRDNRVELKWLSPEPKRFDSFISRHARRSRFTQKSCFLFLTSPGGELDPLFFFFWLRTKYILFLKKELTDEDPQFDGEEYERSYSMVRFFRQKLVNLEISLPKLALQADMVPVLSDLFSEIPFFSSLRALSRDRTSEIGMVLHLLKI